MEPLPLFPCRNRGPDVPRLLLVGFLRAHDVRGVGGEFGDCAAFGVADPSVQAGFGPFRVVDFEGLDEGDGGVFEAAGGGHVGRGVLGNALLGKGGM